ncbi:AbrB family transcriptional regulator [Sphingomonas endophytica]|uniref:AbrB family transcriptional regulator n=1 Tax=Sphingomonas endophytica TaxID=869719 RepID=UPI00289305CB|nr:AbrB family transcriptional regulator [Sphingomonas endophytica]
MATRSAPVGDVALRFIAAVGVGAVGGAGFVAIRAPLPWVLASAQVGLGPTSGCRFGGPTLRSFVRITALAAGSTLILLALTFGVALILGTATGLDPALLALAHSPGGLAGMSMVALSLALEPGGVIVHHLARVILVLSATPLAFHPPRPEPQS